MCCNIRPRPQEGTRHGGSSGDEAEVSFQIQDHGRWVLQVLPPQVGEPAHGGSVDDPVVGRPADVQNVSFNQLSVGVEPWKDLEGLT